MVRAKDVAVRANLDGDDLLLSVSVGRGIAPPMRLGIRDVPYRRD